MAAQAEPERFIDCLRASTPYHEALAFHDVDGRPLGESNAPEACRIGVELEWRACPYDDSRARVAGAKINVSALRQLTRRFRSLLGAVGFLREAYARRTGCAAWTLPHLWTLGRIGTLIPTYLMRRRVDTLADGQLPVLVAAMFKSLAGVFLSAEAIVLDAVLQDRAGDAAPGQVDLFAADSPAAALTTEELVTLTNLLGALAHGDAVCAGPPAMIEELLDVLLSGAPVDDEGGRELAAILGDGDELFAFAERMNAITIGRDLLRHQLRDEHARLRDQTGAATRLPTPVAEQILRALGTRDHAASMRLYQPSAALARQAMTRWLAAILALSDRARPSAALRALVVERSPPRDLDRLVDWMTRHARADHPALRPMAETLLACVAHERKWLATLTSLQADVNELCGKPAPSTVLGSAAGELVSGIPSFARAFGAATGVRIIDHGDDLIVEAPCGDRITMRTSPFSNSAD
jgi:hypothetical protein